MALSPHGAMPVMEETALPLTDGDLDDLSVVGIYPSERLAALRSNGSVVTWGLMSLVVIARVPSLDGSTPVVSITTTGSAYAALRDGSVVTWGYAQRGGLSDLVASALDGSIAVVKVVATGLLSRLFALMVPSSVGKQWRRQHFRAWCD